MKTLSVMCLFLSKFYFGSRVLRINDHLNVRLVCTHQWNEIEILLKVFSLVCKRFRQRKPLLGPALLEAFVSTIAIVVE